MPSVDTKVGAPWPVDGVARIARRTDPGARATSGATSAATAAALAGSTALDPGAPPVDAERVAVLRKAIEEGRYPVVPMRVADALIAAGLILRSGK